jgi:uncharacterized membrane protein
MLKITAIITMTERRTHFRRSVGAVSTAWAVVLTRAAAASATPSDATAAVRRGGGRVSSPGGATASASVSTSWSVVARF